MPDTPTARLRVKRIDTGDYLNTWGSQQNLAQFDLLDEAIAGFATKAVNAGGASLTSVNYATDEARRAVIRTTGDGGTLTVPAVSKLYLIHNTCTGDLTVSCGGTTAVLAPGEIAPVYCDGAACFRALVLSAGGQRIRNVADPTQPQDAATRAWVLAQLAALSVSPWAVITANTVATPGARLICNTSGGAFTVTLPASPAAGTEVTLMDALSTWDTNALTVGRAGQTIAGLAEDLVIDVPATRVSLVFTGATWAVG